MCDERIFETDSGARAMAIGAIGEVDDIMHPGQGGMQPLQPPEHGFWPLQNGGELVLIYCFVFLYIAAQGAGAWSIDRLRHRSQGLAACAETAERVHR